jgi:hypothetical protein
LRIFAAPGKGENNEKNKSTDEGQSGLSHLRNVTKNSSPVLASLIAHRAAEARRHIQMQSKAAAINATQLTPIGIM